MLKKEIVTLYRPTRVWAQDQRRTTVPTHQLQVLLTEGETFLTELRVSRRHGRVSPEEQGRNLGRSVTAIYRLFSVARQVVLSTSNLLGPVSLARWVMV